MAQFTFNTNNILTGTNKEHNYKLAMFTFTTVIDPVSGVLQVDAVNM